MQLAVTQNIAEQVSLVPGIKVQYKILHKDPNDTRPIVVRFYTPGGTIKMPVDENGDFEWPDIPKEYWSQSTTDTNLGKGAVSYHMTANISGDLDGESDTFSLKEMSAVMLIGLRRIDDQVWESIGEAYPEFYGFQILSGGIYLNKDVAESGQCELWLDDKLYDSIDLSGSGSEFFSYQQLPFDKLRFQSRDIVKSNPGKFIVFDFKLADYYQAPSAGAVVLMSISPECEVAFPAIEDE